LYSNWGCGGGAAQLLQLDGQGVLLTAEGLEVERGGGDVLVAEAALDLAEPGALLFHGAGEGVAQIVDLANPKARLADVGDGLRGDQLGRYWGLVDYSERERRSLRAFGVSSTKIAPTYFDTVM
jgi:hypothetical protein